MRKKLMIIFASIMFLYIYLKSDKIFDRLDIGIMNAGVLPMEEINLLCEGKEDTFMEPEITINGGEIAYDSEQNLLLVPQNLSEELFEGSLEAPDGELYFLEDEALTNRKP